MISILVAIMSISPINDCVNSSPAPTEQTDCLTLQYECLDFCNTAYPCFDNLDSCIEAADQQYLDCLGGEVLTPSECYMQWQNATNTCWEAFDTCQEQRNLCQGECYCDFLCCMGDPCFGDLDCEN